MREAFSSKKESLENSREREMIDDDDGECEVPETRLDSNNHKDSSPFWVKFKQPQLWDVIWMDVRGSGGHGVDSQP